MDFDVRRRAGRACDGVSGRPANYSRMIGASLLGMASKRLTTRDFPSASVSGLAEQRPRHHGRCRIRAAWGDRYLYVPLAELGLMATGLVAPAADSVFKTLRGWPVRCSWCFSFFRRILYECAAADHLAARGESLDKCAPSISAHGPSVSRHGQRVLSRGRLPRGPRCGGVSGHD
jgi:hypothetical protein